MPLAAYSSSSLVRDRAAADVLRRARAARSSVSTRVLAAVAGAGCRRCVRPCATAAGRTARRSSSRRRYRLARRPFSVGSSWISRSTVHAGPPSVLISASARAPRTRSSRSGRLQELLQHGRRGGAFFVAADLPQRQRGLDAHQRRHQLVLGVVGDELAHVDQDAGVEQLLVGERRHHRRAHAVVGALRQRLQQVEHVVAVGGVVLQRAQRQRRRQPALGRSALPSRSHGLPAPCRGRRRGCCPGPGRRSGWRIRRHRARRPLRPAAAASPPRGRAGPAPAGVGASRRTPTRRSEGREAGGAELGRMKCSQVSGRNRGCDRPSSRRAGMQAGRSGAVR